MATSTLAPRPTFDASAVLASIIAEIRELSETLAELGDDLRAGEEMASANILTGRADDALRAARLAVVETRLTMVAPTPPARPAASRRFGHPTVS